MAKDNPPLGVRRSSGFTLIELMVTIALFAIIMSMAVPSFQRSLAASKLTNATNELMATLAQARSEAIRQGRRITVCKSANGSTCTNDLVSSWANGWIMFADTSRSTGNAVRDNAETVTQIVSAFETREIVIRDNFNFNFISYSPEGRPLNMDGGALFGRLRVCSTSNALGDTERARELNISIMGRINLERPSVSSACGAP